MTDKPANVKELIVFLLIPDFSMIAFTSAIEVLRIANRFSDTPLFEWIIVTKEGGPIEASNGLSIQSTRSVRELDDHQGKIHYTFVCSGFGVEHYQDKSVFNWLRKMERRGSAIGAMCTGSWLLARAGLIDGHRCVIHWENLHGFQEVFPEVEVSSDLFEIDRNRLTCSGGVAALDMMLSLVNDKHGQKLAVKISECIHMDRMRDARDRQRLPIRLRLGVHHPKLIIAVELMEANIEEPLTQDQIAYYSGLSRRQLERLFRKHIGRTPAHYYLELRLERARNLLYQTDMAIMDIALACGFISPSHFSTCYRQLYGKTPRAERSAIQMFPPNKGTEDRTIAQYEDTSYGQG